MIKITSRERELLSPYIFSLSGIFFDQSKEYLLQSRLSPLLQKWGCGNFTDLYRKAVSDERVKNGVVDAVTTNETFFFRDKTPFELLQYKILPELIDRKKKEKRWAKVPVKIWCAASSTGQEPYTIAMVLKEALPDQSAYDIQILGTDLSEDAYARASYGLFSEFDVKRGLPQQYLRKYFKPYRGGWRVNDEIRILTRFEKFNLLHSFSGLGTFDIIFCRNVAIYFVSAEKTRLFQKIKRAMNPEGYLLVGGSESLSAVAPDFEMKRYLGGIYYQVRKPVESIKEPPETRGINNVTSPLKRRRSPAPVSERPLRKTPAVEPVAVALPDKKPEIPEKEISAEYHDKDAEGDREEESAVGGSSLLSSLSGRNTMERGVTSLINIQGRGSQAEGKGTLLGNVRKDAKVIDSLVQGVEGKVKNPGKRRD